MRQLSSCHVSSSQVQPCLSGWACSIGGGAHLLTWQHCRAFCLRACPPAERQAISNMIQHFGSGVFATVMDSYNYQRALDEVLPAVKAELAGQGGFWVLRPDSGAPCWWRQWGVAGGASLLCPPQPCKMFNRNWGFN